LCCLSFLQEYDELLGALLAVRFFKCLYGWLSCFSWSNSLQWHLSDNSFWSFFFYDLGSVFSCSWFWLRCFIHRPWCRCRRTCKQILDVQNESEKTRNVCKWLRMFEELACQDFTLYFRNLENRPCVWFSSLNL